MFQTEVDHFPPVTNRHVFPRERSRSPNRFEGELVLTNRRIFIIESVEKFSSLNDVKAVPRRITRGHNQPPYNGVALNARQGYPQTAQASSTREEGETRPSEVTGLIPQDLVSTFEVIRILAAGHVDVDGLVTGSVRPGTANFSPEAQFKNEPKARQEKYLNEAVKKHPFLGNYPETWPAEDFARMYQKNRRDVVVAKVKSEALQGVGRQGSKR
ncbi:hypothetical protein BDN72DRAFT_863361 [Pluteus cervinus]|uniref:Uncharacterized protein n=1 Tax=Pluteus cervinus TaxID=181527 RepID=A0ACD3A7S4_9AGAR|nr:hypothetical protein BDN72DRAFT_863361 [Pluteus cervinus]